MHGGGGAHPGEQLNHAVKERWGPKSQRAPADDDDYAQEELILENDGCEEEWGSFELGKWVDGVGTKL